MNIIPNLRLALIGTLFFLFTHWGQSAEILWTQYCQHLNTMKLIVHLDADPLKPSSEEVTLWIKKDSGWEALGTSQMFTMTSTALFEMKKWPRHSQLPFRVTCGESSWEGTFRAEPKPDTPLRMMGVSCIKDIGWPWKDAIQAMIEQDPDLVYFPGDQIYENDYGSPHILAKSFEDVGAGMQNYLEKFRKFGFAFRELLRDRPSIMITDDHDVYANDLWGKGGAILKGDRTTGGYPCHPNWVNAVELTQTGMLPEAVNKGPHGDGVLAYYTALEYGGVRFAILEDRKFKSPPSEVITKAIVSPKIKKLEGGKDAGIEVVRDPDFDCRTLDRPDLQLLGKAQEKFLTRWSRELKESGKIGAVLSQSPWAHVALYSQTSADLDSNGWPQSGRNRALDAIGDAPVVMVHGDVHLGTLFRNGVRKWNDGPVAYSLPAFSSKASRRWEPSEKGRNRLKGAPENTGEFLDRFGNKITMYGAANDLNGYGMIIFDQEKKAITMEFYPMSEKRVPMERQVPGWPHTVNFK